MNSQQEIFKMADEKQMTKEEAIKASAYLTAHTIDQYKPRIYTLRPFEVHNYVESRLKGLLEYDMRLSVYNGEWLFKVRKEGRENQKSFDLLKDDPELLRSLGAIKEAVIIEKCIAAHLKNEFPKEEYTRSVACQKFDSEYVNLMHQKDFKEQTGGSLIRNYEEPKITF